MSLPYTTFYSGSSCSAAYNSYNFCDKCKLFAVLNLPVNSLSWSWRSDLKYAFKVNRMNVLKKKSMIL